MDHAVGNELSRLCRVGGHVGRGQMRFQGGGAFPLFDHDEGVRSKFGLKRERRAGVDGGFVFDAAVLGPDRGHIGAEHLQDGVALAVLGGDDGDDVDNEVDQND